MKKSSQEKSPFQNILEDTSKDKFQYKVVHESEIYEIIEEYGGKDRVPFKHFQRNSPSKEDIVSALDYLGHYGWELASAVYIPYDDKRRNDHWDKGFILYLKRRYKDQMETYDM